MPDDNELSTTPDDRREATTAAQPPAAADQTAPVDPVGDNAPASAVDSAADSTTVDTGDAGTTSLAASAAVTGDADVTAPVMAGAALAGAEPRHGDIGSELPPESGVDGEEPVKKKRRGLIWLIIALLLIAAAVVVGVKSIGPSLGGGSPSAGPTLKDMDGRPVIPDDPDLTDPSWVQAAGAVDADHDNGFVIDSVGLNVPLGSVNAVNNVMNPPGFSSAYWVRNMGVSLANADQGTVYIVAHSTRGGGRSPGNYVIDVPNQTTSLKPGDIITADNRTYKFVEAQIIDKNELGDHPELWANQPGRLIFITCLQKPDNSPSVNNMVIIATLVS